MRTSLHVSRKMFFLPLALSLLFFSSNAQNNSSLESEGGGAYPMGLNDATHPCVTAEQYVSIKAQIAESCAQLKLDSDKPNTAMTTSFNWPLRTANGLSDCSYYYLGNYVDQDPTVGIKDWNCGTVTYDGHRGNDIALLPYPFLKMNNDQVEVIAAAAGTIVYKADGNFDKNCAANNLNPNYIAIQHADGTVAVYLHMKKNSLTVKTIGQTVAVGEFLGRVGSSGSSSAPHLHFEVWTNSSLTTLLDAYYGACNLLNNSSMWAAQKPYTEPEIVKIQVNKIAPVLPACPTTETTNEDSCFVAPGTAQFYFFIRDETIGLIAKMRIINPNNTTFSSWQHNSNVNYKTSYWYNIKTLPTTAGTYTFEAVYNGDTCRKTFKINCVPTGIASSNELSSANVFPNPFSTQAVIKFNSTILNGELKMYDVLGEEVMSIKNINTSEINIDRGNLRSGIYFFRLLDHGEIVGSGKLIAE